MDFNKGKAYLTVEDLWAHSIWKFNDIDDLIYPVTCSEDFPEDSFDLRIRTKFFIPCGIELLGYIVGLKNIFSIRVYSGDQMFGFNRNLPQDYPEKLNKLSKVLDRKLTMKDFSPLKYVTDIDLEGFRNIEGEFDLLKKRTDEERLKDL